MKIKEYLEYVDKATVDDNGNVVFPKEVYEFNKELIEKYPCLKHNALYNENEDKEYDYSKTWLDEIPRGWAIAFGEDIIREINDELVKFNFVDEYKIVKIKEKFGLPTFLDNDANVAGLAEACLGAAKDYATSYFITCSTGVGGAFVVDKKLISGGRGHAGEIGNMIIIPGGYKQGALNPGAVEGQRSV